jgi:hypothetical protein
VSRLKYWIILIVISGFNNLIAQNEESSFKAKFQVETLKNAPIKLILFPQKVVWGISFISIKNIQIFDRDNLSQANL